MSIFLCIILTKSKVLEAEALDSRDLLEAIEKAQRLYRKHKDYTRYEIWRDGKKVHAGEPEGHSLSIHH